MARQVLGLVVCIAVCFAAAGLGGLWTSSSVDGWYRTLSKPAWNPPGWVFGPVWTVLYLCMGVALWLVWREAGFARGGAAIAVFLLQLVLNAAWSGLFFGLQRPGAAFADIVALWLAIAATVVLFWPISKLAGGLLVPYLGWVSFAAGLNYAIWRLNT